MSAIYDEIEIEDMTYDEDLQKYTFPCPCGDKFSITLEDLLDEEDIGMYSIDFFYVSVRILLMYW